MEYVIVSFPTSRNVFINGNQNGKTNEKLRVPAGTHRFDLGPLKNYTPDFQDVPVSGTTVLDPKMILFSKKDEV